MVVMEVLTLLRERQLGAGVEIKQTANHLQMRVHEGLDRRDSSVVNSRGNPGVSAANPYPTPQKPLPLLRGKGFGGYG